MISRHDSESPFLDARFGKFVVNTAPVPKPGPGEILVKVKAAALNPVEWKTQKYAYMVEECPAILVPMPLETLKNLVKM